jgi:hypothetical protein
MRPKSLAIVVTGAIPALGSSACERRDRSDEPPASAGSAVSAQSAAVPAAAVLEPCRLLTEDEASAFLGGPATATPSDKVAHASSCIWTAHGPLRGLQVMTSTPAQLAADEQLRKLAADTIEKRYAQLIHTLLKEGKAAPVTGLGDGALWAEDSQQLWIMKKGRALITVSFHGDSPVAGALDKSKGAAGKVLERL